MNMLSLSIAKKSFTRSVMEWSTTNPKMVLNIAFTHMTKIDLHEKFGKRFV